MNKIRNTINSCKTLGHLEVAERLIENFCNLHRQNRKVVELRAYFYGSLEQKKNQIETL